MHFARAAGFVAILLGAVVLTGWILSVDSLRAGYFDLGFGTALLVLAIIVLLTGVIWQSAAVLNRTVSQRNEAQAALLRERAELADFVEHAPVGLHWVGADGTILWVNQAELDLLGYRREEYVGRSIVDFHVDGQVIADILGRLKAGETLSQYEARLRCKDGSIRQVQITSNVKWEDGRFVHTRCFTRDVTERRRAQEAVVKIRDTFLSVAGHELRTPLGVLSLTLHNLARRLAKNLDEAGARDIRTLQRQLDRLMRLTEDLLEVGRIHSGRLALEPAAVDLSALASEIVDRFQASALAAGSTLALRASDPVVGTWDGSRLDQVLSNILANALKFGQGGSVEISVSREGDCASVSVRDHGIGIPSAEQSAIFERFGRTTSAKSYGGLGLGLWISKQIVEAHGGTISVASEQGNGSTFQMSLPGAGGGA